MRDGGLKTGSQFTYSSMLAIMAIIHLYMTFPYDLIKSKEGEGLGRDCLGIYKIYILHYIYQQ